MSYDSTLKDLLDYSEFDDPVKSIFVHSIVLMVFGWAIYALFGFWIPDHREFWYQYAPFFNDKTEYLKWVECNLTVPYQDRFNRLLIISYLSMYVGMWLAYFRSKRHTEDLVRELRSLEIQSLRRLLGHCSLQWNKPAFGSAEMPYLPST